MALYVILAILLLGILIMGHELGHFVAARLTGIAVKEFSIGFGPKLYQRVSKKTGLKFTLRWLPLGGYCMFFGDETDKEGQQNKTDERCFTLQPVWKRLITVFSGPLMNFIIALIAAILMLLIYYVPVNPYIAAVGDNSPAHMAGLQAGDEFVLVGDINVDGALSREVTDAIQIAAKDGGAIELTVRRGKELVPFTVTPVFSEADGRYMMGISVQGPLPVSEVLPEAFSILGQGSRAIIDGLRAIFTTREGLEQTAGVIGMVQQVAIQTQQGGMEVFLFLMVIISINLGLINLLPIPGLDGCRIVFMLIEAVRRKPVNQKIESMVHLAGYALLFVLMIVLVFKDVGRIFGA